MKKDEKRVLTLSKERIEALKKEHGGLTRLSSGDVEVFLSPLTRATTEIVMARTMGGTVNNELNIIAGGEIIVNSHLVEGTIDDPNSRDAIAIFISAYGLIDLKVAEVEKL